MPSSVDDLTDAQNELYKWIKDYMKDFQHSPSIRQMMQAMGLKSPAPIQSRLRHLQEKGYISWQEGKARTLQIVDEIFEGVPSKKISNHIKIPTIGIGSSVNCDGQVLVIDDLTGLSQSKLKFVKKFVDITKLIETGVKKYKSEVSKKQFPKAKHSFLK